MNQTFLDEQRSATQGSSRGGYRTASYPFNTNIKENINKIKNVDKNINNNNDKIVNNDKNINKINDEIKKVDENIKEIDDKIKEVDDNESKVDLTTEEADSVLDRVIDNNTNNDNSK